MLIFGPFSRCPLLRQDEHAKTLAEKLTAAFAIAVDDRTKNCILNFPFDIHPSRLVPL